MCESFAEVQLNCIRSEQLIGFSRIRHLRLSLNLILVGVRIIPIKFLFLLDNVEFKALT